jgi:hypothetical protein
MLKNAYKSVSAVVLAALVAGAVTVLPGASDEVVASAPLHAGKGDRLDTRPRGIQCSANAWPYFEAGCVRDTRVSFGKARPVRVVTADRIAIGH